MRKTLFVFGLLAALCSSKLLFATSGTYKVKTENIYKGYITQTIPLSEFSVPKVEISNIIYLNDAALPKDATLMDASQIKVSIGMERKKPIAIIHIPAFSAGNEKGKFKMVQEFTLTVTETKEQKVSNKVNKTTDVANSVLASGKWYKIGIFNTGLHIIDYSFLSSLGIDPGTINPSKIRIFGNGGNMLSEDNRVNRTTDLMENAIYVSSTGSTFANGDYIIFNGLATTAWMPDSINKMFHHSVNLYTDTAYYFLNFDQDGAGLRVPIQFAMPVGNVNVTSYDYYAHHEVDLVNPAGFGKMWYGEQFNPLSGNLSQTYSFHAGSNMDTVYCSVIMANTDGVGGSSFTVTANGKNVGTSVFSSPTTGDNIMNINNIGGWVSCNNQPDINVNIVFTPADNNGVGYLDNIEINGRRQLILNADQMSFRDWRSVGLGNIATYQIQNASSNTVVWDITNPLMPIAMNGTLSGTTYTFNQDAQTLHEFIVRKSNNLYTPKYFGQVPNQNLHGLPQVNCIIVTAPVFLDQASKLADFHRSHDHLTVAVATTTQVYNEFSSGGQDISAIRDFERMFYKRAGSDSTKMPQYVILFGGASYDYKDRLPNNSNFIPVFESWESTNDLMSFSSDDFYGFLDDNEYIEDVSRKNMMDIAVGRLPARNISDANALVDKVLGYSAPNTLGPWRITSTFVADNVDQAGDHMGDAEMMNTLVTNCSADLYNYNKIYLDALNIISTPAGTRCPDANVALNGQIFKGTFFVNYSGHGNTQVWASERILTQDDFNNWNNRTALPFMVTATCDFGQFDHPQYVSAAEQLALRPGGGAIVMLTTTQAVYEVYNKYLNSQYLTAQFIKNSTSNWNTFGEAARIGKNVTYTFCTDAQEISNFRKFSLLGDPAITPDFPQYKTIIDSIIDVATATTSTIVKALGEYRMTGRIVDDNKNLLSDFSGDLFATIFDKPRNILTISGTNQVFQMQDNVIYKGKATVVNGKFSFSFITPKDINYYLGSGKISVYAQNGVTDAAGVDTSIEVGGYSDHPVISTTPPIVRPYINDSLFKDGGITGSNTSLFVILNSATGINVSGNSVGHDLIAVLDDNREAPYLLNDFYETAPNTFQMGFVNYPLTGLTDGIHKFEVTAWDVNDNTGSGVVHFSVIDGRVVDIQNLGNYPNPFDNLTHFVFEHNHPMEELKVQIEIYSAAGGLVKNINETFTPQGSWSNDITWDGTDNNGARLPSGVYVYRLNVTSNRGFISSAYQKLVIVR